MGLTTQQETTLSELLTQAVREAVRLPSTERAHFVGQYILAMLDGEELPVAEGKQLAETDLPQDDLSSLADIFTKVLNRTHGALDPLRALAEALTACRTAAAADGGHLVATAPATADSGQLVASALPELTASGTELTSTALAEPPSAAEAECAADPAPSRSRRQFRRASIETVFERMDRKGDGQLSRADVLVALRHDAAVADLLGVVQHVSQEGPTRAQFEAVFQRLESDNSKVISRHAFLDAFTGAPKPDARPEGEEGAAASSGPTAEELEGPLALEEGASPLLIT
jgi:hypothetical protein